MSAMTSMFKRPKVQVARYGTDPDVQRTMQSRQAIQRVFSSVDPNRYADIRRRRIEASVPSVLESREAEDRALGFNLARTGQYGSSQDIEGRKLIDRAAIDQARELELAGRQMADSLREDDTMAELGLTGAASGAAATGSAIENALAQLRQAQGHALGYGTGQVAGQAVADLSSLYPAWRTGIARRQARDAIQRMLESIGRVP
jgi:hypothetical protein